MTEPNTNAIIYQRTDPVLKGIAMEIFKKFSSVITYPDNQSFRADH